MPENHLQPLPALPKTARVLFIVAAACVVIVIIGVIVASMDSSGDGAGERLGAIALALLLVPIAAVLAFFGWLSIRLRKRRNQRESALQNR